MSNEQKKGTAKPFQRNGRSYPDEVKKRIVKEVQSGVVSQRGAERIYKINRKTIDNWITHFSLVTLNSKELTQSVMSESTENSKLRTLSKQVMDLKKALDRAQLKIDSLETMINVSEEEFKIKIRKKHGAKQSEN